MFSKYSIKREGPRWLVMSGWAILASFSTKGEANEYIAWLKEQAKKKEA